MSNLNFPLFIAKRITTKSNRTFSKLIVRVAIAGIMLGLTVMILAVAVLKGFKNEIIEKQRGFSGDVIAFQYDLNIAYDNMPISLSDTATTELKAIDNVKSIYPFATKPGIINVNDEVEGVVLKGIDARYDQSYLAEILVEGKGIDFSDANAANTQILVSQTLANRLSLSLGDDFLMYFVQEPIRKRKFEIVGIFNLGVEEIDKVYVIGSLPLIQRLNNWDQNTVGGYEMRVNDFSDIETTTTDIVNSLPIDLRAVSIVDYYPEVFKWLDLLDVNTEVILVLMVLVAVINMISALLIMILERTGMIGILKALGFTNGGIRQIFLYNSAYLIGYGLLLGNLVGLGLCLLQSTTRLFKLDEASYYVDHVPISISFADVVMLNGGTLIICLLVLLIPSGLVSRINPVKAISFK
ncbi:ABC transporter permease [Albibacterium indicum]|uniref:ABC transporter permease n=1 Tax=Albibacterium indicum TaxID=2292082 RepID=UPI002936DD5E|nr:FtsX-like permease family protein [Pedobacter indicus]